MRDGFIDAVAAAAAAVSNDSGGSSVGLGRCQVGGFTETLPWCHSHCCCPAGILGPVVLEAAVGAQYAPLGMLATVGLYFQQLPLAQLLFQLHQRQQQQQQHGLSSHNLAAAAVTGACTHTLLGKVATSPEPCSSDTHSTLATGAHRQKQQQHTQQLVQGTTGGRSSSQAELVHLSRSSASCQQEDSRQQHGTRPSWDLEHQHQQGSVAHASAAADADGSEGRPLLGTGGSSVLQPPQQQQSIPSFVLSLLLKVREPGEVQACSSSSGTVDGVVLL